MNRTRTASQLFRSFCPAALTLVAACGPKVLPFTTDDAGAGGGTTGGNAGPDCPASTLWLPHTPAVTTAAPAPHPASECPFYQAAWQNFLIASEPVDGSGRTALENYAIPEQLVTSVPAHAAPNTPGRAWLGDVAQPGGRQILIDQNGRTLFYGSHVNPAFVAFAQANGLTSPAAIQAADPGLELPEGVVELESAWQEVAPADPSLGSYVTTLAWVSSLSQDPVTRQILEDRDHPRQITVRLLALHVAFTLPGHPEMIWSTFEHSEGAPDSSPLDHHRNLAPSNLDNPPEDDLFEATDTTVLAARDALLYRGGTPKYRTNRGYEASELVLDPTNQRFSNLPTSIHRAFPASRSHTIQPPPAVTSLNHNMEAVFAAAGLPTATDKRSYYRLVGAVWLDKPRFFTVGSLLQNDQNDPLLNDLNAGVGLPQQQERQAISMAGPTLQAAALQDLKQNGTDSPFSIQGGQDRLAGTATESFMQPEGAYPNCLRCHNTHGTSANGVPHEPGDESSPILLDPKLLNVSRVFSTIVRGECLATGTLEAVAPAGQFLRCAP